MKFQQLLSYQYSLHNLGMVFYFIYNLRVEIPTLAEVVVSSTFTLLERRGPKQIFHHRDSFQMPQISGKFKI